MNVHPSLTGRIGVGINLFSLTPPVPCLGQVIPGPEQRLENEHRFLPGRAGPAAAVSFSAREGADGQIAPG